MKILLLILLLPLTSICQMKIGNITIDSVTASRYILDLYQHPDTFKITSYYSNTNDPDYIHQQEVKKYAIGEYKTNSAYNTSDAYLIPRKPCEMDFIKWFYRQSKISLFDKLSTTKILSSGLQDHEITLTEIDKMPIPTNPPFFSDNTKSKPDTTIIFDNPNKNGTWRLKGSDIKSVKYDTSCTITPDTIPVIIQYIDTSRIVGGITTLEGMRNSYKWDYDNSFRWMLGYFVRSKKAYLDGNKKPLGKNIIVWLTK